MKEVKTKSNGMPVAIIVLVLVVVVGVGFWFYRNSKPTNNVNIAKNTPTSSPAPTLNTANAPPGAQPPNMLGSPTAIVTIEEFADFQCGSCAAVHPVMKDVLAAYAGNKNVKFIYRNYPLTGHDKAYDAAVAAEAAGLQGSSKFWVMQDQLFMNQHLWSKDQNYRQLFADYAQKIGLDVEKFKADMSGMQAKLRVDQDLARARAIGVSQTPTVLINSRPVPYAEVTLAGMKRIIEGELQGAAAASQPAPAAPSNTAAPLNSAPPANSK